MLIVALIALPVLATTLTLALLQSSTPSAAQRLDAQLGRSDMMILPVPHAQGLVQVLDSPSEFEPPAGGESSSQQIEPAPSAPPTALPESAALITLQTADDALVRTPDGFRPARLTLGPAWDEQLRGRFAIRSGRAPSGPDEAMVSPGLLTRLNVAVGSTLRLQDGTALRITGTLARIPADQFELFVPASTAVRAVNLSPRWYVRGWSPNAHELQKLNDEGYGAFVRELVQNPPEYARIRGIAPLTQTAEILSAIAISAGTFLALLTALLAATALSVSAQRQRRSLAIVASVGAQQRDVRRIVLLQGGILAAAGAVAGIGVGVALATGAVALLHQEEVGAMWGNWGLRVPWLPVLAIAAIACASGIVAAVAPARRIAGGNTLAILRGSRRPARVSRRMPRWGVVVLAIGIAGTLIGALVIEEPRAFSGSPQPAWIIGVTLLTTGSLMAVIGLLFSGHWLLTRLALAVARAGSGVRIAVRDAAAHPTRVVPAFTAIAVSMVLATYAISALGLGEEVEKRRYTWSAPLNAVVVSAQSDGAPVPLPMSPEKLRAYVVAAVSVDAGGNTVGYGSDRLGVVDGAQHMDVFDANGLKEAYGIQLNRQQRKQFENGAMLLIGPKVEREPDGAFEILKGRSTVTLQRTSEPTADGERKVEKSFPNVPIVRVAGNEWDYHQVVSIATAKRFGVETSPTTLLVSFTGPLSTADEERLRTVDATSSTTKVAVATYVERGPMRTDAWVALLAGVASLLVLGAASVALGLARYERRADDATLSAVGGDTRLRRRINAAQAFLLVGMGTVPGTILGLLPIIGNVRLVQLPWTAVPWIPIVALAVGLPLMIGAVSWLIPPRRATLTHRTAIT